MEQLGRKVPETTKTSRNNDIKEIKQSATNGSEQKCMMKTKRKSKISKLTGHKHKLSLPILKIPDLRNPNGAIVTYVNDVKTMSNFILSLYIDKDISDRNFVKFIKRLKKKSHPKKRNLSVEV